MPLLVAGCQSNAQQDLVARELRMQEDQIYAMEDYLSQYQQLVCKYRSENAALRRRLADEYYDGEEVPTPRTAPPTRRDGPSPDEPAAQPNGLDLPDVPPLEGGASNEPKPDGEAALAAGQTDVAPRAMHELLEDSPPVVSIAPAHHGAAPHQVWLHGEIVANDAGGGPRLAVDVEPLDAAGRCIPFAGQLSLMLLATQADGGEQSLARWDFTPEDATSAVDSAAGEHAMRFYLELPPDTPVGEATQIWVRLVSSDGDKVLAYTEIQLDRPGQFASHLDRPAATDIPARIVSRVIEGDWTIARPGEPANLPTADEESSGGWRTSSEPIPVVVQASATAEAVSGPVQQAFHTEAATKPAPPVYKPPTWSPERHPTAASSDAVERQTVRRSVASRPSWSSTR